MLTAKPTLVTFSITFVKITLSAKILLRLKGSDNVAELSIRSYQTLRSSLCRKKLLVYEMYSGH